MGAASSCTVNGAGTASDTEWGWWFFNSATASTYTYNWRLMADTALVTGALPAAAKFIAGPPPQGQIWPVNISPLHTGNRGSTAQARQSGASEVKGSLWYTYGVDTFAAAETSVPNAGGTAQARSTVTDPWDVSVRHMAGLPTVLMVSAQIQPMLAPQPRGGSAFALHGTFGEIRFGLKGDATPECTVALADDWQVYLDVAAPPAPGMPIIKPARAHTADEIRQLFLDQHDPTSAIWTWRRPAPTLTFVRPVPAGVTTERIEVSLTAEDADEAPVRDRQRRRDKDEVVA